MGLFGKLGNLFHHFNAGMSLGFKKVKNGFKKGFKRIYSKAIKPFYKSVIKPIGTKLVDFAKHSIDRADKIAGAATDVATGIGGIFKSPLLLYGALGIGALVVLNVIKK